MLIALTAVLLTQISPGPSHIPTAQNYRDYLAFVQPNAAETKYKDIAWRNTFWPAVQEAKKLGRPILFWTMNGHPLGCT
ncbi:hypothetical protein CCB80_09360 [Armatimonadetes bacterium Uphvl-Ar1]|nr:hypothetical protein CCB80_09360 [Armatimonadetes bacterium Uphvl-Ar1]